MSRSSRMFPFALAAALLTGGACADAPGDAKEQTVHSLSVSGVRISSAAFREKGTFGLGLVAKDADGKPILSGGSVSAALAMGNSGNPGIVFALESGEYSIAVDGTETEAPIDAPAFGAILLDDSGSMSGNDPNRLRAEAAKVFWEEILPVRADNKVALLDFGAGGSDSFSYTRLLQDWTRSTADLEAQLPEIQARGGTPLYESLEETVGWMQTSAAAPANRGILLLSDGQPSGDMRKTAAIEAAKTVGIRVHTVGLGPASDQDVNTQAAAVSAVRDVAEGTGGVYASATNAEALRPIFATLAQVSAQGQLVANFTITPVPAPGTRVSGTVTLTSGGGSETANWSFLAP